MICWKVDKNSPLPIYKQLVNLVRDSVASGQLRKGEVLPSQRQLAKLLGLSRATIVKAMEEMTDAGLVDIKERNQASHKGRPMERLLPTVRPSLLQHTKKQSY